jgi:hypothetical protein
VSLNRLEQGRENGFLNRLSGIEAAREPPFNFKAEERAQRQLDRLPFTARVLPSPLRAG